MSDAFLGMGNTEISPFWNWGGGGAPMEETMRAQAPTSAGAPTNLRQAYRNAFSGEVVLKKDLSLDDVRKRATVLQI